MVVPLASLVDQDSEPSQTGGPAATLGGKSYEGGHSVLVMPTISREPVAGKYKARLNRITGMLRIDPSVPDGSLHYYIQDAIMVLSGHPELALYAQALEPRARADHLTLLPGGLDDGNWAG